MKQPWATSTRTHRLPPNWPQLRHRTKTRANNQCEGPTHPDSGTRPKGTPRCTNPGTECDHITPGDNHHPNNLQWLCHTCHKQKTQHESAAASKAWRAKAKRPTEQHPGTKPTNQQNLSSPNNSNNDNSEGQQHIGHKAPHNP